MRVNTLFLAATCTFFLLSLLPDASASAVLSSLEAQALADLGDATHPAFFGWTPGQEMHACTLFTPNADSNDTIVCQSDGAEHLSVIKLVLSSRKLHGELSDSLGNLVNLVHLDLSHNTLTGSIPTGLGALANLKFVNLSQNAFSGPIPNFTGSYSYLNLRDAGTLNGTMSGVKLDGPEATCDVSNLPGVSCGTATTNCFCGEHRPDERGERDSRASSPWVVVIVIGIAILLFVVLMVFSSRRKRTSRIYV